ncbi:MAG: glycosyltransferase family 4 protein, partial [Acidimicrobiales bacterium]
AGGRPAGSSPLPRVLVIVQNLPVPLDRRVWLESRALVGAGYGVSVICPAGPGDAAYQELEGVCIHRYRPPRQAGGLAGFAWEFAYCWARTAWLSLRVLRREGFDVIQACNPPDTYWLLARLYRLLGKRFVFDHHDLCPEVYEARFGGGRPALRRALVALERASVRSADHVVSTNESYRRVATTRAGVSLDRATVVRSGPDTTRLYRQAPEPALKAGRRHLCAYLGVMGPQDGVDVVVRAADVIVHGMGRTDCHFALLGFGDCLADLRALATGLGLDDWVTFTGRADDAMIRRWLSTADVGLSPDPPTAFNDLSTMNKTLEYMAFGLPVVAYDLAETRVSAGDAAVYVDQDGPEAFATAVCALLDDPGRREAMGNAGAARIRDGLSWIHQAAAYVAVYDRLTGRAPARAAAGDRVEERA